MTKLKMKVEEDDLEKVDQDQGDFVLPKPGYYVAAIKEANAGFSKTDGKEDRKKPRLELILQIVGVGRDNEPVTENYGNIWDYISFSKESGWKRGELLWALGYIDSKNAAEVEIDTDELVGQQMLVGIKHENRQDGDGKSAKVRKYLRFTDGDEDAAFGSGGGDETVFGDDDGGDDSGYLTEEALMEMDLKELGDLAKEFDLNPQDFIVRNRAKKVDNTKTKEAIVQGILDVQAAPAEEEGEAGDDDSPF